MVECIPFGVGLHLGFDIGLRLPVAEVRELAARYVVVIVAPAEV